MDNTNTEKTIDNKQTEHGKTSIVLFLLLGILLGVLLSFGFIFLKPEVLKMIGIVNNEEVTESTSNIKNSSNTEIKESTSNIENSSNTDIKESTDLTGQNKQLKSFSLRVTDTDFDKNLEATITISAPIDSIVSRRKLQEHGTMNTLLTFSDKSYLAFSFDILSSFSQFNVLREITLDNGNTLYISKNNIFSNTIDYTDNLITKGTCGSLMEKVNAPCSNRSYMNKVFISCRSDSGNYNNCEKALKTIVLK